MNVNSALSFLITTLFDIYIWIVLTRFILQLARADFYNPISQFIVKATSPVLNPLRRLIPGFGGLDVASLTLFVGLIIAKLAIYVYVLRGIPAPAMDFLILFLMSTASLIINYFLFVIFVSAILSWVVAAGGYNPFADLLRQISEPVLAPARRVIPPMGGLDISPMLVMIGLIFVKQLFGLSGLP